MLRYFDIQPRAALAEPAKPSCPTYPRSAPKPAKPRAVPAPPPPPQAECVVESSPAAESFEYDPCADECTLEDGGEDDDALESDFLGDESPCHSAVDKPQHDDDDDNDDDDNDDVFMSRSPDPDTDVRELLKRRRSVDSELWRAGSTGPELRYDDEDFD
jgi:hypothetical protein